MNKLKKNLDVRFIICYFRSLRTVLTKCLHKIILKIIKYFLKWALMSYNVMIITKVQQRLIVTNDFNAG